MLAINYCHVTFLLSVLSCCFCQDDDSSDSEDSSEMEQSYSINLVIVKWMKCCSSAILLSDLHAYTAIFLMGPTQ